MIKKLIALFGCVLFVWLGLGLVIVSKLTDYPTNQGIACLFAALSIGIGILFAGYGNSLPWKKDKK